MNRRKALLFALMLVMCAQVGYAINERGDSPWTTKLRSYYDKEMHGAFAEVPWLLNLGPTGIRARIYQDRPHLLVVKYVFQDDQSPAKGKIEAEDVIAGANGKTFTTSHRFGRNLGGRGGWDGPMLELAGHIEDSQGKNGVLELIVWPKGNESKETVVKVELKKVGRFSETFPYDCKRSAKMLEELCDFLVMDYKSDNWKSAGRFYGAIHGKTHQMLALMASGLPKYKPIIEKTMAGYYDKKYDPAAAGFQCWDWGFDGILMGEYYLLTRDKQLLPAMKSLAEAMPWGSMHKNGIYTHRSEIFLRRTSMKPYASIASISGLQMTAMSIFKVADVPYSEKLHARIHQHYLNSVSPEVANVSYAFGGPARLNPDSIRSRHAVVRLKDPTKGLSGKGPGYVCPTGMKDIGAYEIMWPTKKDRRWKPTDWVAKEARWNLLTELGNDVYDWGEGVRRIDRNHPDRKEAPEPTKPYKTTGSGRFLASVGMGALAHLIGNEDKTSWEYLGRHCANSCAINPGNAFDGHAASNLHGFWSVLGAARCDQPEMLRKYFDYMKTFIILSETHNGGLILQPWGRDRANTDTAYGPRLLPTATGAILLSLGQKRLQITGAPLR